MLIAQLSDPHIKLPGRLAYRQVDTATLLGKAVAGFIGTMNRLRGTVVDKVFRCAAGEWPGEALPADAGEILFRPEDVHVAAENEPCQLAGTVSAAFFLGDRTRLFVDVGQADPLVVESHVRREFTHGDPVYLRVDPRGVLVL